MIDLPKGFQLAVAAAGIKKPGRNDMAVVYSKEPCATAGVFTANLVKAAPVMLDMVRARYGRGQIIIVNSGNANACTGAQGMLDAREMAQGIADELNVREQNVYVCSTGVIGVPMPMQKVRPAIKELAKNIGTATVEDLARAIMTTDTFPKMSSRKLNIGGFKGTVTAVCKGAGMIDPNMATMLCFILTDFDVEKTVLKAILKEAVDLSFNAMTVDGECSTNDTALIMANGAIENPEIRRTSEGFKEFSAAVNEVTMELARMIARDGEGATKLVNIKVNGARNDRQARIAADALAKSLLLKTAIYGGDPNWGRIMSCIGSSGASVKEERVDVYFGKTKVVSEGLSTGKEKQAEKELKGKEVDITVELNLANGSASALTCDLTEEYIRINSQYTT